MRKTRTLAEKEEQFNLYIEDLLQDQSMTRDEFAILIRESIFLDGGKMLIELIKYEAKHLTI